MGLGRGRSAGRAGRPQRRRGGRALVAGRRPHIRHGRTGGRAMAGGGGGPGGVARGVGRGVEEKAAGVDVVQAAGGVVWRPGADGAIEVLVVHRPKYGDWSLPKGKLDAGEDHVTAALHEVEEETGFQAELGVELPSTSYRDRHGRPKKVRYWMMRVGGGKFVPNHEVDKARWLAVEAACDLLTYERDQELLREFARQAPTLST